MKKVLLIIGIILVLLIIGGVGFYFWGITPKDNNDNVVVFTIEPGTSKTVIAKNLAKAGLIKSDIALDVYLFFNKINIQAGDYELSSNMKPEDMLKKFSAGDVKINSSTITLVEGKRLTDYADALAEKLDFSKDDIAEIVDNTPEKLLEIIKSQKKLVSENISYLRDLGVTNYQAIFIKYYDIFLMDNSNFKDIFKKYEKEDLIEKLKKNINIVEFL